MTYLRDFTQLLSNPAFSTYTWFCINHLGPLQCVFLCLTYLQYNRASENQRVIYYYVDEVFRIFASSAKQSNAGHGEGHERAPSEPTLGDRQIPLAWRRLVELRNKLELPPDTDQPLFESKATVRCETLPSAIALRTISLASSDTNSNPPTRGLEPVSSGKTVSHTTSNGYSLPSNESQAIFDHAEGPISDAEMDNILDISDLAEWSSSLVQDPQDLFHLGQNTSEVNGATNPLLQWDLYAQALGMMCGPQDSSKHTSTNYLADRIHG